MRILVVASEPVGAGALSVEAEVATIRRGFEPLVQTGEADVVVLARATPARLHAALQREDPTIVHFIGHGRFDRGGRGGALLLEDERGEGTLLGPRAIRELLCRRSVRLVFLNACHSGTGDRRDATLGLAQTLVAQGLPALVAHQYAVHDATATQFARHLYHALGRGVALGPATREARVAVSCASHADAIDWAIPVVYARDPGIVLCRSAPHRPRTTTRYPAKRGPRR